MAHLSLSLFGGFNVTLGGIPVVGLRSDKVRALLAYLAVENGQPHRRERLAGLLWPESTDVAALNSLRTALANLRRALGDAQAKPPFFLISREAIRFNPAADAWLDVSAFAHHLATYGAPEAGRGLLPEPRRIPESVESQQAAVRLYRGSFLADLSVNSPAFEDWVTYRREQFQHLVMTALKELSTHFLTTGEYGNAQVYIRQELALDPYNEEARRRAMWSLALAGQRNAALAEYETCRRLLVADLGVTPAPETERLYADIRDGSLKPSEAWKSPTPATSPPQHVRLAAGNAAATMPTSVASPADHPVFVARQAELARLNEHLRAALDGHGRLTWVIGEAGSGKTVLLQVFAAKAMVANSHLLVAHGNCNAQAGIGDPYLPFVEIMQLLTGDIEAQRAGGALSPEHARRLWAALPDVLRILSTESPDLIGSFVSASALITRAEADGSQKAAWRGELVAQARAAIAPSNRSQTVRPQFRLFEQFTSVLTTLAQRYPLLLILDDLQWADAGSLSLLFHLSRRLTGSRILVLAAYRPEDLENSDRLERIVNETKRLGGDICIDLGETDGRGFVDALLERTPNNFGDAFRQTLYHHTGGHALFTVELLQGLHERGDLVQDANGYWRAGPTLNWELLPARTEAVIAERIGRLPSTLRAILSVASVEGEEFTAEVVARAIKMNEHELIDQLSGPNSMRSSLASAYSFRRLDPSGQHISLYRFQHYLFQRYLYRNLDRVQRARWHQAIGEALEAVYKGADAELEALSPRLAHHFEAAEMLDKAIHYLIIAGDRAVRLAASDEAIAHFTNGLRLLQALPESPERARQERILQLALGMPLMSARGWAAPERAAAFARGLELSGNEGATTELLEAQMLQADLFRARGELTQSLRLGKQMLAQAQRTEQPFHLALAHHTLGASYFFLGVLREARSHLEETVSLWRSVHPLNSAEVFGLDIGTETRAWLVWVLWASGHVEQAHTLASTVLAEMRALGRPFGLGLALMLLSSTLAVRENDVAALRASLAEFGQLPHHQDAVLDAWCGMHTGWLRVRDGEAEAGIAEIRRSIDAWQAAGTRSGAPYGFTYLADACLYAGKIKEGLAAVDEALSIAVETGASYSQAELLRLRGELLWAANDEAAAEKSFREGIDQACRQGARQWELRATVSLANLLREQGRGAEACQLLSNIYSAFTEGFDTRNLRDARRLLAALNETPCSATECVTRK